MSDLGPTSPHETFPSRPVSSAISEPSVAGMSGGAGARHLPRQPPRQTGRYRCPWPSRLAGKGYGDCWRTEEVGGSLPLLCCV